MFNRIILAGHLTKDPTLRYTPQGIPVATVPIAVNTVTGPDKQEVLFIDVIAFNKAAERTAEYLFKGSPVLIEGRLVCRKWEGPDGTVHQKYEVIASSIKFLPKGEKKEKGDNGGSVVEEQPQIPEEEWSPF